jgi:hypothetical protein
LCGVGEQSQNGLAFEIWNVQSEIRNAGDVVLIDWNDTFGLYRSIRCDRTGTKRFSTNRFSEPECLPMDIGAARVEGQFEPTLAIGKDSDRHHYALVS